MAQTTTTTKPPEPPSLQDPCGAMQLEVQKYTDWDANIVQAIAKAENGTCSPTRHNETMSENHGSCVGSYGVLQVGCIHYREGEDRNDLATNIAVAHRAWLETKQITKGNGYTAWTMFRNGEYRKHLQ